MYKEDKVSVVSTVGEKDNGRLKIHANTKPKWRSVESIKTKQRKTYMNLIE